MKEVYSNIPRQDSSVIEKLRSFGVATIHECMRGNSIMEPDLRPLVSGQCVAGPAVTAINTSGDNLAMHIALSVAKPGDVLVVTSDTPSRNAVWGELATTAAIGKGLAAVVTDGAARDVAAIRVLGFPVWARWVSPLRSSKQDIVGVNVPVVCGGVTVNPGDIVVADDDGIVIVPNQDIDGIISRATQRLDKENSVKGLLSQGKTPFEVFDMKTGLQEKNVTFIDDEYGNS